MGNTNFIQNGDISLFIYNCDVFTKQKLSLLLNHQSKFLDIGLWNLIFLGLMWIEEFTFYICYISEEMSKNYFIKD